MAVGPHEHSPAHVFMSRLHPAGSDPLRWDTSAVVARILTYAITEGTLTPVATLD